MQYDTTINNINHVIKDKKPQKYRNRSGVGTALPRFARPGRDWIHHESLASAVRPVSHRSGTVTAQVS